MNKQKILEWIDDLIINNGWLGEYQDTHDLTIIKKLREELLAGKFESQPPEVDVSQENGGSTEMETNKENNLGAGASYMIRADEEITLDLIMHNIVKQCQNILAKWILPDSGISDKDCLTELLGILNDQSLVRYMHTIEASLNEKK